jgi:ribosomal protein S13
MGLLTDIANKMAADERAQQLEDRLVDAIADAIKVVVDEDVDREGQMDTARLSLAIFRALARVAGQ